ncbi:MAG: carboxymuconolactone decarboxylase family protein [Woeseiaceae bacterium]|nr:carboxymuconolactone decarboxylase family protein [Woeseiaceae bacterium]
MLEFPIHTIQASDDKRREALNLVADNYGFVPKLLGGLAESPTAVRAYLALGAEVHNTAFTPEERTVAWFAVITANDCHYCIAAHTAGAIGEKIDASVLHAARNGGGYAKPELQALHDFVRALIETRGRPSGSVKRAFAEAGFTPQQALECVLIVAHKTLSNYANALIGTPIDDVFSTFERSGGDTTVQPTLADA